MMTVPSPLSLEKEALARRLLGVIKAHEDCGRGATVVTVGDGPLRSGALHYPCGATIPDPRGLVEAERRHLADALAAEALAHLTLARRGVAGFTRYDRTRP